MGIFRTGDAKYSLAYAEESAMVDASELLARALEDSGMTRTELAEKLGVSKSEVTARLKGERNITIRSLAKTLHVLDASLKLSLSAPVKNEQRDRSRVIPIEMFMKRRYEAKRPRPTERQLIAAMEGAK